MHLVLLAVRRRSTELQEAPPRAPLICAFPVTRNGTRPRPRPRRSRGRRPVFLGELMRGPSNVQPGAFVGAVATSPLQPPRFGDILPFAKASLPARSRDASSRFARVTSYAWDLRWDTN